MKFKSPIFSQVSGSIAGMTFSHNRGGLYTRSRTIPVNPSSEAQVAVRAAFSGLVSDWINTLTDAQREAWTLYALNTPLVDRLGDPLTLTGQQMYIRCNTPRVNAGFDVVDDGPTTFGEALLTSVSLADMTAPDDLDVGYDATNPWATNVGGGLFIQVGQPQNPTINYFKGPYRFAGSEAGAIVPPTPPVTLVTPFTYTTGQKIFMRVRSSEANGRLSAAQFFSAIVL